MAKIRIWTKLAALLLGLALNGNALAGESGQGPGGGDQVARSRTRVQGFQSPELDFQLLRQLGSVAFGGASVGESLDAASRIGENDPDSWVAVFAELGRRQEADGAARAARGNKVSARDQLWKAANSYRAAEYFADFKDPRHRELGRKSREAFVQALSFTDYRFEVLEIPFEGLRLPAYFISPHRDGKKHKTIMVMSGYDGTLEEIFLAPGRCALERGYNLFLFAGPGQMDTLRFHPPSVFRPDYEKPISAALDLLLARPDVDARRVALNGISFGGYFAVRAAALDNRIQALIANSPIVDWHRYLAGFIGFDPAEMADENDFSPETIAQVPDRFMNPVTKRMSVMMMARYGRPSFKATYQALRNYTVEEADLKKIRCPVLALVGAGEGAEPRRQLELFAKSVSGPVTRHVFTTAEGADGHCQVGNPALSCAVLFDWLDEIFQ